jgi:type IV pilus assembly protein PilM
MSLSAWFSTPPPDVAVAIDRDHVGAVRLSGSGERTAVAAHAIEALPQGAVVPGLTALNVPDVAAVGAVVARVLQQIGGRSRRVALVLPDATAKVSLLRLATVPGRAADLQEIVRWQVRKTAPFPVEQAVLSITNAGTAADGGHDLVVALAREEVVRQYEQACAMAGAHAGLVDLATFAVITGLVVSGRAPAGDWLLVNVTPTSTTLAVVRGDRLIFYRNRGDEGDGTLADLIHQTAMYYEDRLLGRGFERVWLAGGSVVPGGPDLVHRDLTARLGTDVEIVDLGQIAVEVDGVRASPALIDALGPLVGVLRRERRAA